MYFQEEASSIHSLPLSESSGLAVLEPGWRSNELRNHLELTRVVYSKSMGTFVERDRVCVFMRCAASVTFPAYRLIYYNV